MPTEMMTSGMTTSPLSPRERAVARLVVHGLPRLQVASVLAISVKTVNNHLSSVFQKLGIKRRAQLCALAPELGLD